MINVTEKVRIARPVSEVYRFAAEPCNIPRWQKSVASIEAMDGEPTRGERFKETRRMLEQEMKTTYEFLDVAPNSHLKLHSVDGPFDLNIDMQFKEAGSSTDVTTTMQAQANMALPMDEKELTRQFTQGIKDDNQELKNILEKRM